MTKHDQAHPDDSYLWDGSGTPDPDVVRLERALGVLQYQRSRLALPPRSDAPRTWVGRNPWLAAAAVLTLVAGAAWVAITLGSPKWVVTTVAGLPAVEGRVVSGTSRLARGAWLVTDSASRARIAVSGIGSVDVDPNTRLRLVTSGSREHRLALDHGTIHARIWAPPKFFYVDTQAAVAVDLGCAYTLHAGRDGDGLLRVTHGWVGFERDGRTTYVPEGAISVTRADRGPGTPRYEDAPSGYGGALMLLDFGEPTDPARPAALTLVLSSARRRDALTLWHLLTRGTDAERRLVYDRLAALVPPPEGVTREAILSGNRVALARWWDALGVETSTWWRLLKKKW